MDPVRSLGTGVHIADLTQILCSGAVVVTTRIVSHRFVAARSHSSSWAVAAQNRGCMVRSLTPRALTVGWLAALGLCVGASSLSASNGRPPEIFLPVGLSTAVYVTSGYLMARRRSDNRIGYAVMLIGVFQAATVALRHVFPVTEVFNVALSPTGALLLAYVLLAYPTGYVTGRLERAALVAIVLAFAVLAVATIFSIEPELHGSSRCPPCVANPLRVTDLSVFPIVNDLSSVVIVTAGLVVSVLCVRRWARAHGSGRWVLAPVLFGGIVTALGIVLISLVFVTGGTFDLGAQVQLLLQILVPIGLAVTFVRVYAARGAVVGAVVQLGASPSIQALEAALRKAVRDPELMVVRWSGAAGAYLDREGHHVPVDSLGRARAALRLEREGQPLAAVIHDAALEVDPVLVETVADAVRFSVDATDIRDQLRARGGDVEALPRGEVAFLFGDLEGSTEMLAAMGDAYIDVLAELRRIVRESTDRHGGRVVDARADECFLAFADPGAALAAAVDIQHRMANASWPAGAQPRMRMGLHLGTPELTADGYVGMDVHRAARVMAMAHGGQILATAPLAVAIGGRPKDAASLVPVGYQTLKGIPEPEFLYRVVEAGQNP